MVTEQASCDVESPEKSAAGADLRHMAFFYRDQRDYLAQIRAFSTAGTGNGEPVFITVPGQNGRLLREQIGAPPGHVRYADMEYLGRNPARIIPELQAFLDCHPGQPVRYVGESVWPGRSAAEIREAVRHEALINLAFAGAAVTIMCPYDAAGLPGAVVGEAERTHPDVLTGGRPETAVRYAGPGNVPPACDRPLPAPPADAECLAYRTDLRLIRRMVTAHAGRAGLSEERTSNLVLAASELAANTLRHTRAGGTAHIWHTQDEILCQIQDTGCITDPMAGRIRRGPEERGHGLWVVNQMCDLVELRTGQGGSTIRLHMCLPGEPGPAASTHTAGPGAY